MNKFNKIADGLASWLNFELRVGRENIFSESYMAQPIGQLLNYRYPGNVISEVEHPILADTMKGPGKRPRIDFVVKQFEKKSYDIVVETKWISKSPTLLRDLVRDVVRLDMLIPRYSDEGILILAGKKRDFDELFTNQYFKPYPGHRKSREILSIDGYEKNSVRFLPIPKFRENLYTQVLDIYKDLEISQSIQLERSGPFPRIANINQYVVYLWKIRKFGEREKFVPKDYYYFNMSRAT